MSQISSLLAKLDGVIRYVGISLVVLGAVACIAPVASGTALAFVLGLVLLAVGALLVLFGLRVREGGKGSAVLAMGGVAALCGVVLIFQPSAGLSLLRWILIPYLLVSGASEAAFALRLRSEEGRETTLGGAAVSILAGLSLLVGWPISGARAVGLLLGAKLIASGLVFVRLHRTLGSVAGRLQGARDALAQRRSE